MYSYLDDVNDSHSHYQLAPKQQKAPPSLTTQWRLHKPKPDPTLRIYRVLLCLIEAGLVDFHIVNVATREHEQDLCIATKAALE